MKKRNVKERRQKSYNKERKSEKISHNNEIRRKREREKKELQKKESKKGQKKGVTQGRT